MFRPDQKKFTPKKAKKPLSKFGKSDTSNLRRKLDAIVSKIVRASSTKCFTCPERSEECGHFMRRGNDATRWDFDNLRPQCKVCNRNKFGNLEVFRERLEIEIGIHRVLDIERRSKLAVKFSQSELQEMIDELS